MYAGIDFTGSPDLKQKDYRVNLFGVSCAVVNAIDAINDALDELRSRWGLPTDFEFHGHEMTEAQLLYFAEWFTSGEINVFVALLRKSEFVAEDSDAASLIVDKPALLFAASARLIVRYVFDAGLPLKRLWLDEDIPEPKRSAFDASIKRDVQALGINGRLYVKHRPSSTSTLVQLADVAAYLVQREERGSFQTEALRVQIRAMWHTEGNVLRWITGGDLRPYL